MAVSFYFLLDLHLEIGWGWVQKRGVKSRGQEVGVQEVGQEAGLGLAYLETLVL